MDNEFGHGMLTGALIGAILMAFVYLAMMENKQKAFRADAVKRGFAEYVVDKHGEPTFKWKEVPNE